MGGRLGIVLSVLVAATVGAAPLPRSEVPEPLRPWIDWALHGHEDARCPFLDAPDTRECAWPSRLALVLDEHGGRFTQQWLVHRAGEVPLPGDGSRWPQQVRVGDRPAVVTDRDGTPVVHVETGTHTIAGTFEWDALPELLPTPARTGIVTLTIGQDVVAFPNRDGEGRLWLRARRTDDDAEARLDVVVVRRLRDDVPATLTTRLELNVAGKARETVLAKALPDGFVPLGVESPLPARIEPDGRLRLQLRPGAWTITITGRHEGRMTAIALPQAEGPWVSEEVWSFEAIPALREVTIEGVDAIDPTQTMLPADWRRFPAYRLERGDTMKLGETRRGDTGAAADQLVLHRTWWLDFDGGGYTVKDHVTAARSAAWRLEMAPPLALGRVAVNGRDLPITRLAPDGPTGVELRDAALDLDADARLDGATRRVPAVGWSSDFTSVSGVLNLPPGWRLFHARGVDSAEPTWVAQWSLLDLFLVLVTATAVLHLYGRGWGSLALAALVLTYPEPVAPRGAWLAFLAAEALRRALPPGRMLSFVRIVRLGCLVFLVAIVASFVLREARLALHPSVLPPSTFDFDVAFAPSAAPPVSQSEPLERLKSLGYLDGDKSARVAERRAEVRRYAVDPAMKVQTGPGTPTWRWSQVALAWQGPVERGQEMRLLLVPPWANRILGFVRIGLLALLLVCMVRDVRLAMQTAAALLVVALGSLAPVPARAEFPPQPLLDELRSRLLEAPACAPSCVGINRLALEAGGDVLRMRLEVDAGAGAGVALPGSANDWMPASVLVDGKPAAGLVRATDGRLWLMVGPGRHDVLLEGRLPPRETVAIPLPEVPGRVTTTLSGWTIAGVREDGLTDGNLQLTRISPDERAHGLEPGTLPPFVRVTRALHLGLTWDVETTVERLSPLGTAIVLDVPALEGEAVTTGGVRVVNGKVAVSLAPQAANTAWHGVLDQRETIALTAPADVAWVETWTLDAGSMWHVEAEGVPLVQPGAAGERRREWRPWPGESATLRVTRPAGVPGPTLTIDASTLVVRPGLRATDATLELSVRSSQGGRHRVRVPPGATLGSVTVNGQTQPIRQEGDGVTLSIVPGAQTFKLAWRSPEGIGMRFQSPPVDLGAPSVNATAEIYVPESRWILAVGGPSLGPAVLFWSTLVVIVIAAMLLARTTLAPLGAVQWFLLGIGLSQVDVAAAIVVVGWFLALGWRRRDPAARAFAFDARQIALAIWTAVMLVVLFVAIRQGLLGWPDMQIAGNGSSEGHLRWYADRATAEPPRAWVVSAPLMVYRLAMLAWALWAAVAVVRHWLPWGWESFGEGGLWRRLRRPAAHVSSA